MRNKNAATHTEIRKKKREATTSYPRRIMDTSDRLAEGSELNQWAQEPSNQSTITRDYVRQRRYRAPSGVPEKPTADFRLCFRIHKLFSMCTANGNWTLAVFKFSHLDVCVMTRVISLRGSPMKSDGVVTRWRAGWHARWIPRRGKWNIHLFTSLSCLKATLFFREMFLPDGGFSLHPFEKQKRIMKYTVSVGFYCRAAHYRTVSTLGFKADRSVSITSGQECVPTWQQHSSPCGSPPVATHSPTL